MIGVYADGMDPLLAAGFHHLRSWCGGSVTLNPSRCDVALSVGGARPPSGVPTVRPERALDDARRIVRTFLPGQANDLEDAARRAGPLGFVGNLLGILAARRIVLRVPLVDRLLAAIGDEIGDHLRAAGLSGVGPTWPDDRPFAVGLSHDVDRIARTYQVVTHPGRLALRGRWTEAHSLVRKRLQGEDDFWGFPEILEIEDGSRLRSTWFWLNEARPFSAALPWNWKLYHGRYAWEDARVREMMRTLASQGHEVGVHNSIGSRSDPARDVRDRARLEEITGSPVRGARMHYLADRLPECWDRAERAGFLYDSSAGYPNVWGFRMGTCLPFRPVVGERPRRLVEVPMVVMDRSVRDEDRSGLTRIIEAVREVGGCLVLNWHNNVFGPYYEGLGDAYRSLLEESRSRGAWIAPLGEVVSWWNEKHPQAAPPGVMA